VGQLFIKRLAFIFLFVACPVVFASNAEAIGEQTAADDHQTHSGHGDNLLLLLRHKIALQKLQDKSASGAVQNTLLQQDKHLRKVMPTLKRYMATPKSYYLTSDMYHDSLENRAAMLADFTDILIQYQKQLVSTP
jgi:hypothetical protein